MDNGKQDDSKTFWGIVELMGHVRLAGRVSEEERFGTKLGRIDIPKSEPCTCANAPNSIAAPVPCQLCNSTGIVQSSTTQYFGGASIYRVTPVSEEVARHVAATCKPAPVQPWEFPRPALAGPKEEAEPEYQDDDDDPTDAFR